MNILHIIFINLEGDWSYTRVIRDNASGIILGTVHGTVLFKGIRPIQDNNSINNLINNLSYHYIESGQLTQSSGQVFKSSQEYLYTYQEQEQQMSKLFIKDSLYTGHNLFYHLKFEGNFIINNNINNNINNIYNNIDSNINGVIDIISKEPSLFATGQHLCHQDHYLANYQFDINNNIKKINNFNIINNINNINNYNNSRELIYNEFIYNQLYNQFKLSYQVIGPKKNYNTTTIFERKI